jgi:hypothetical protein
MQNALPRSAPNPLPQAHAEVLSRLACVRHALRLVDPYGGGPAPDPETDEAIAAAWDAADETKRRRFETRSRQLVGATAAGIDALRNENEPNVEASAALVDQIRGELRDIAGIILD